MQYFKYLFFLVKMEIKMVRRIEKKKKSCKNALFNIKLINSKTFFDFRNNYTIFPPLLTTIQTSPKTFQVVQFSPFFLLPVTPHHLLLLHLQISLAIKVCFLSFYICSSYFVKEIRLMNMWYMRYHFFAWIHVHLYLIGMN